MAKKGKLLPDDVLFGAVSALLEGISATEIARTLGREYTREQVYPMLKHAKERGLIRLLTPHDNELASVLAKKCGQRTLR